MSAPLDQSKTSDTPQKQLSLWDAVSIIVGVIIGAGIYESTPTIAGNVGSAAMLLVVFALGGLITLVGALCYAELATTYPREGGDYVYLRRAYGSQIGFLFAWCEFWIVRPGNIGFLAYVLARYANELVPLPLPGFEFRAYACAAVLLLTGLNVLGVQSGKWTQNVLTAVKVIGLLLIFIVGLAAALSTGDISSVAETATTNQQPDYRLAMIFVMVTYGGIGEISFVASEVRNPSKNIVRALLLGTAAVTAIYLLVNIAFVGALGFAGVGSSQALASDVVRGLTGEVGAAAISLLIVISCLGAMNGTIFTGARIYYALGQEHRVYRWLGKWSSGGRGPVRALCLQGIVAIALIILFGPERKGFENLVTFTAPFFYAFFFLVSIALFVLRWKDSHLQRVNLMWHLSIPIPLIFCAATLFMLYSSVSYAWSQIPADTPIYSNPRLVLPTLVLGVGIFLAVFDRSQRPTDSTPVDD